MHLVVLPLLFVLGAGKLAMVLGGAGQGQPAASPGRRPSWGRGRGRRSRRPCRPTRRRRTRASRPWPSRSCSGWPSRSASEHGARRPGALAARLARGRWCVPSSRLRGATRRSSGSSTPARSIALGARSGCSRSRASPPGPREGHGGRAPTRRDDSPPSWPDPADRPARERIPAAAGQDAAGRLRGRSIVTVRQSRRRRAATRTREVFPMTQVAEPGAGRHGQPRRRAGQPLDRRARSSRARPAARARSTTRPPAAWRSEVDFASVEEVDAAVAAAQGGVPGLARDVAVEAHRDHVPDPEPGRAAPPGARRAT